MNKIKAILRKVSPFILLFLILLPLVVFAQLPRVTPPPGPPINLTELELLIGRVARFFTVVGVILAVIYIIWGAIMWMAAGPEQTKISEGRQRVKNGVWAVFIILAVFVIIETLKGVVLRTFFF